MDPKSLPIGWDSGVLSQEAEKFVLPPHFPEPERGCVGVGGQAGAFVGLGDLQG